jgi:hypothetical protein
MSEQELREFLAKMAQLRAANTATPEQASQFLKAEGFLAPDGTVAEPYARAAAPNR